MESKLDYFREPAEVETLRRDFPEAGYTDALAALLETDEEVEIVSGDDAADFPPLSRRPGLAFFVAGYCARCRETAALLADLKAKGETAPREWTLPDSYAGATWEGWLSSGFGQSRDSEAIERVNFEAARAALEAVAEYPGGVQVIREGHWAVGWVEWIGIRPDCPAAVREAARLIAAREDYPVLDEGKLSEVEFEEVCEGWESYGRDDAKRAAREAIRNAAMEAEDSADVEALADASIEAMTGEEFDAAVTGGMADYETDGSGANFRVERIGEGKWTEGTDSPDSILEECRVAASIARDGARLVSEVVRLADPALPLAPDSGIPASIAREARSLATRAAACRIPRYVAEAVSPAHYPARPVRPAFGGFSGIGAGDPFAVSNY